MIDLAERAGTLQPGDTILEPSSGNTGIGLALVAKLRGYHLRVVLPDNVSVERRQLLEIFGADIVLSDGAEGSNGAIRLAEQLAADEPSLRLLFQYGNPANPLAHYEGTGPEIWRDCPEVDVFVAGLGTSGTLMGVGRFLKERKPDVRIVAVEPEESPVLSGGQHSPHKIQGIGAGFIPDILDRSVIDEIVKINSATAIETSRALARNEGIPGGISSGAAIAAALAIGKRPEAAGKTILAIVPSFAERYLSTALFEGI